DNDGDDDVFFADGAPLPGYDGPPPRSRLYRNDRVGTENGRFVDITDQAELVVTVYGSGGTAADIDGDGDLDLYVTGYGVNQLFRNNGDGTFTDITRDAGVGDRRWSVGAAFADPDRDGDLDLYVANYVAFSVENHVTCDRGGPVEAYCHPDAYPAEADIYYRNRGDGTFEDATRAAGLHTTPAPGLGVLWSDLDQDGDPDLYIANDEKPNLLFENQGDGTFVDISLLSGTSHSDRGATEAGMGIDSGDFDADGDLDLVVTNFELETHSLYANQGSGIFLDARYTANLAEPTLRMLAFGIAFADFDHDTDLDLVVANGHVLDNAEIFLAGSTFAQRNQLFENQNGRFTERRNAGFERAAVSRGLAIGDLDRDGDLDVVILNIDDVAEVWENKSQGGNWLQIDLADYGIDSQLRLTAGTTTQLREVRTGSSYASQHAMTVHIGVGSTPTVDLELLRSSQRQHVHNIPANRRLRIR
ncbi:MAG: CRTAC1 family protein, partial [Acidobacteriota bacterium]